MKEKRLWKKQLENSNAKGMKWFSEAKRFSARPGENVTGKFSLPTHVDDTLTSEQSAERIAVYFSKISKEYTHIKEDQTAPWMEAQDYLNSEQCSHIHIEEYEVYQNMKAAKKTDSVPGDIPSTILKEFFAGVHQPYHSHSKGSSSVT